MSQTPSRRLVLDNAELRAASTAHAERSLVAAAAAWADVLAETYPPSARGTAHRAFRQQLEKDFCKAVDGLVGRRAGKSAFFLDDTQGDA